jgi:alternate signal-mediated exported protein
MKHSATKSKKSKRQRRTLIAALVLAVIIVMGGTFAWLTSKDQVTNKLSASNTYDVTITENYTPPENWIPGQSVTKEVGVLNAGNVDALVRLTLDHKLVLYTEGTAALSEGKIPDGAITCTKDEAIALRAGGKLVTVDANKKVTETNIDTKNYEESETGWYIFARHETLTAAENGTVETTTTYAGYYYDKTNKTYYPMAAGYTPTTNTPLFKTKVAAPNNPYSAKTVDYSKALATEDNPYIQVTFENTDDKSTDDDIVINIYLNKTEFANWTYFVGTSDAEDGTFYYNYILTSGGTSGNLITSVELDKSVSADSYVYFDYDLNITAESVQATADEAKITAANETWAADGVKATLGTGDNAVSWAASTTENPTEEAEDS